MPSGVKHRAGVMCEFTSIKLEKGIERFDEESFCLVCGPDIHFSI